MADLGTRGSIGGMKFFGPARSDLIGYTRPGGIPFNVFAPTWAATATTPPVMALMKFFGPARSDLIGRPRSGGRSIFPFGIPTAHHQEGDLAQDSGQDVTVGNPVGSHRLAAGQTIRWNLPMQVGRRTISVQTYCPTPGAAAPIFRLLPNDWAGIPVMLTSTGVQSTSWQTVGPLSFTVAAKTGVQVEVYNPNSDPTYMWVDNLWPR